MAERFAISRAVAGQWAVKDTQVDRLVCLVFRIPGHEENGARWVAQRLVELLNKLTTRNKEKA
ncbi:MAG: hypothetical protein AB7E47_05950 [Desulfovibrionaceae bacterium]